MKKIALLVVLIVLIGTITSTYLSSKKKKEDCLEHGTMALSALQSLEDDIRMDIKYLVEEHPCVVNRTCKTREELEREIQKANRKFQDSIGKISEKEAMKQATNEVFDDIKKRNLQMTDLEISAAIFKRKKDILLSQNGSSQSYNQLEDVSNVIHLKSLKEAQKNFDQYVKCLTWTLLNPKSDFDLSNLTSSKTIEQHCGYRQLFFELQTWETCQSDYDDLLPKDEKSPATKNSKGNSSQARRQQNKFSVCKHPYQEKSQRVGLLYETQETEYNKPCGPNDDNCIVHSVTLLQGGLYYSTAHSGGGSDRWEFLDTNLEEGWQYLQCQLPYNVRSYFSEMTLEDVKRQPQTVQVSSDQTCSIDIKIHEPNQDKDFIEIDCGEHYMDLYNVTFNRGNVTFRHISGT